MGATSACDLPRNRKQVYNLKYSAKNQSKLPSTSTFPRVDVLAHVMQMCKESSSSETVFVRSVEGAPEPMCVLATDQQLVDIERFCTGDLSSVLSIDRTFNLGAFNVTPTTYRNLLVETTKGNNPILLGPILVHQTKTFRPFHYFGSTLIRLNPRLVNLRAYGTDGEPELIKAFGICFPKAVHLRCTNHMRQNIKEKLRTLNIPQSVSKEFLADIFGTRIGSHFEAGLADADSEASFAKSLKQVEAKWNNLEMSCNPSEAAPQFHAWFCRYKAEEIAKCVLPKARRQAGCVDPTSFFTTNSSESLNHVIKQEVEWKESQLPQLIESLKSITNDQNSEVEKAVVGRGEWHFTPQYKSLVVTESCWFSRMSDAAKKLHMNKVLSLNPFNAHSVKNATTSCSTPHAQATRSLTSPMENGTKPTNSILSVPVEECGVTRVAESTLQNMWTKAERLVKSDGHVIKVPWSDDVKARLVKSSTSTQPHLVTRDPKNRELFCCDKNCPMFKGFSICSHVIATAHVNGNLRSFLDSVNGVCGPNLTAIANHGMPSGTGRKGGVAKRKRNRKLPAVETRSVRPCLNGSQPATETMARPSSYGTGSYTYPSVSSPATLSRSPPFSCPSGLQSAFAPFLSGTTASASSQGQVVVGTNVVNLAVPTCVPLGHSAPPPVFTNAGYPKVQNTTKKPFILKFKTNQIKVCQSCRKNYDGPNDTLGLLLARAERRMVSNLATGTQFLAKETNSHYHLHMMCLRAADPSFQGGEMVIPDVIKGQLSSYQKLYLRTCFQVPL